MFKFLKNGEMNCDDTDKQRFLISHNFLSNVINLHSNSFATDNKKKALKDEENDEQFTLEYAEKIVCDIESGESRTQLEFRHCPMGVCLLGVAQSTFTAIDFYR